MFFRSSSDGILSWGSFFHGPWLWSTVFVPMCLGCTDGQVRLMNGSAPSLVLEGRVEICLNNTYGSVCDDLWNEQAARVACNGSNGEELIIAWQLAYTCCAQELQ